MLNREADDEVAFAIELTNLCQALHCLPQPGGLLDQDGYLVSLMKTVLIAQNEKEQLEADKAKKEQKAKTKKT